MKHNGCPNGRVVVSSDSVKITGEQKYIKNKKNKIYIRIGYTNGNDVKLEFVS